MQPVEESVFIPIFADKFLFIIRNLNQFQRGVYVPGCVLLIPRLKSLEKGFLAVRSYSQFITALSYRGLNIQSPGIGYRCVPALQHKLLVGAGAIARIGAVPGSVSGVGNNGHLYPATVQKEARKKTGTFITVSAREGYIAAVCVWAVCM